MKFGEFVKSLRNENKLSHRALAEKSGISTAEISRIETGERQKPSPIMLKAIAPHLGVTYEILMQKAGYIEEVVDHEGYIEKVYKDEDGKLADILKLSKEMFEKNSNWANLAYRVTASDLTEEEQELIRVQTEALLGQFLKNKNK